MKQRKGQPLRYIPDTECCKAAVEKEWERIERKLTTLAASQDYEESFYEVLEIIRAVLAEESKR